MRSFEISKGKLGLHKQLMNQLDLVDLGSKDMPNMKHIRFRTKILHILLAQPRATF